MSEYVGLGLGSELYMSSVATERKKNWVRVRPPRFRMRNLNPNPNPSLSYVQSRDFVATDPFYCVVDVLSTESSAESRPLRFHPSTTAMWPMHCHSCIAEY